jgi:tetratricopeptide (TPR) repeat protein
MTWNNMTLLTHSNMQTLYNNRAMAYLKLSQPELAMADCVRSLNLVWSSKAAYRHGVAAMALGMHDKALKSFQTILLRDPKNREAQDKITECQELLGAPGDDAEEEQEPPANEEFMLG